MKWTQRHSKRIEGTSIVAHLVTKDRDVGILVEKMTNDGPWRGIAIFPSAHPDKLQHAVALQRYKDVETEVDVEDLLREWSDPEGETLVEFITAEAEENEGLSGLDATFHGRGRVKPKKKLPVVSSAESKPYSPRNYPEPDDAKEAEVKLRSINQYDNIVVSFSGGKDSVACALLLLEMGIPARKIELWHQAVDGEPHVAERFWDWPVTESYCEAFAKAFGFKLLFQWKNKGYLGEIMRKNQPTASSSFQMLNGSIGTAGGDRDKGTRLAFPAIAADLQSRWCSSYVKIDVAKKVFTSDPRFVDAKVLFVTGERRQESTNRARYGSTVEYMDTTQRGRTVHQWRAILNWFEQDVWEIMKKYKVRPHPAYYLGWSRVSCMPCIFGDWNQWASVKDIAPELLSKMARMEKEFAVAAETVPSHTMSRESQLARHQSRERTAEARHTAAYRLFDKGYSDEQAYKELIAQKLVGKSKKKPVGTPKVVSVLRAEWKAGNSYSPEPFMFKPFKGWLRSGESLTEAAAKGKSYITPDMREAVDAAMSEHYEQKVLMGLHEEWELPVGAYRHSGGPT